ncbi:hypothetical protein [Methanoculleus taiwanensis]|uniref:hypothetical protein n=1 Tax=Methanoculleus taiwanensis TaxID=1550565 RepID=UPI000FFEF425|nr:hypothetical protein [Methanoculleus taiwanensis]
MTGISHLLCTVFAVLLTAGCIASPFGTVGDGTVSATGTVTYIDLERGFYGLITENGERYLPLNLPDELAADGLPVRFTGEIEIDIVTFQQWGRPIELSRISVVAGTNETIILRQNGIGRYLGGNESSPGWNGTDKLYRILRQINGTIDCRVTDDRITGLRERGTVVELRTERPWNETEAPPNLTEALFVLHEPMGGDLSGTILLRDTNTSGYVCRGIREGNGLNTSWVRTLAGMTGISPAPDAESRNIAASYVTNLTEYRDYAGENLTLIWAAQGPCPDCAAYTYRFTMQSMKDPAVTDRATVQVIIENGSVVDSMLAAGKNPV